MRSASRRVPRVPLTEDGHRPLLPAAAVHARGRLTEACRRASSSEGKPSGGQSAAIRRFQKRARQRRSWRHPRRTGEQHRVRREAAGRQRGGVGHRGRVRPHVHVDPARAIRVDQRAQFANARSRRREQEPLRSHATGGWLLTKST